MTALKATKLQNNRVGIYSGSFDPIHDGHIAFAEAAIKQARLDKVFFLVEPQPRRKQGVKAFEHRVAMVRLALKHHPKLGSIVLRQQQFTPLDTLPILQERFKGAELHLLMGDDFFNHLASWPQIESLINAVNFIVGRRSMTDDDINKHVRIIEKTKGMPFKFQVVDTPLNSMSSSVIRSHIKQGQKVDNVNANVLRYIKREGLYESKLKS